MNPDFNGSKLALLLDDKIPVILRDNKPNIPFPNHWDLPGGGREGNETGIECAIRETQEEVGITINPSDILWSRLYPSSRGKDFLSSYFSVAHITQEQVDNIVFGDEGQGFDLIPIKDFLKKEDTVPFLKIRLQDYLDSK